MHPPFSIPSVVFLVSLLLVVVSSSSSSCSSSHAHIKGAIRAIMSVRGGSTSTTMEKPAWLQMDPATLEQYKELAKQRHEDAVKAAQESYYSASGSNMSSKDEDDESPQLPPVNTFGIAAPPTWSLPDFVQDFQLHEIIKVTQSPLFTREECNQVIRDANEHFHGNPWTTLPSGPYHVAGFWIKSIPNIHEWFQHMVRTRLFPLLAREFPDFCCADDLVVDNAYLFQYSTATGRQTDVHTDSGCLSFTIALNAPTEYTGGGTWFESLNGTPSGSHVIEMDQGIVTVRPGGVRHCGQAVTSGTRYIIGGFCMHRNKVELVRMLLGLAAERGCDGDYNGAEEAYMAALAINDKFDATYANLASILELQGKTQQAFEILEYCHLCVNPNNAHVAYSLGILYLQKEEYANCKACMETCLDSNDCDVEAIMTMAQACRGLQDGDGEESWYRRAIQTSGVSNKQAALAHLHLGLLKEGTDEEVTLYEKGLELSPSNYQLRHNLASVLALQHKYEEAAGHYRVAVETSTGEEHDKALQLLYRSASMALQNDDSANRPTTRDEMVERIQKIMGMENYQALAASAAAAAKR